MSSPPVTHTAKIQISFNELPTLAWQAFSTHSPHPEIYQQQRRELITALSRAIAKQQHQAQSTVKQHGLD